jgi:membrane protein insertase Oxa1/YidC/SpoIIIJ
MFAFWQAIMEYRPELSKASWLWIGSPLAHSAPKVLGTSLAGPDLLLLGLYMISMVVTMRTATPPMSEDQARQQKIMSFLSPAMLGYFGWHNAWPSALVLYWLTFNLFSILQQMYMQRGSDLPAAALAGAPSLGGSRAGSPASEAWKTDARAPNARGPRKKRSRR